MSYGEIEKSHGDMFEGVLINYGSWMLPLNQQHINLFFKLLEYSKNYVV
jgi:hypothetical protein